MGVVRRDEVRQYLAAASRRLPGLAQDVFDGDRNPRERPKRLALPPSAIHGPCLFQRRLAIDMEKRTNSRVTVSDLVEKGLRESLGVQVAAGQLTQEFSSGVLDHDS